MSQPAGDESYAVDQGPQDPDAESGANEPEMAERTDEGDEAER